MFVFVFPTTKATLQRRTVLQERIRIIPTKMPERMMSRERHKRTHGTRDIKQERTMPIKTG
jgi:hypothetical protein